MWALRLVVLILAALLAPPLTAAPLAAQEVVGVSYADWDKDAAAAEEALAAAKASNRALEDMRARIVDWRKTFDDARAANQPQIDSVKGQIDDLGPLPEGGAPEAPEIISKRKELAERLSRLQAPSAQASAAYRRADGIVKQVDALIRDRQAKELLRLMPSPANPLHWPSGAAVLTQGIKTLWAEIDGAWGDMARRASLKNNMPGILGCLLIAALLLWRGPGAMERLSIRLQNRTAMRARYVVAALVSLGQIVVPVAGMVLVFVAIHLSSITGPRLEALAAALPFAALSFFAARWLGSWIFPDEARGGILLTDRPSEARFHVNAIGLLHASEHFRTAFTTEVRPPLSQAAQAVWLAPLVCIMAIFTLRLGLLLRRQRLHHERAADGAEAPLGHTEAVLFRNRVIGLFGTLIIAGSVIAPALALVGYVAAANALMWPMVGSMALAGFIILGQRFLTDIYITITRTGDEGREALVPVLTGFFLVLLSLPLLAVIWGARTADLWEVWAQFQSGIRLGGTRISPMAIVTLFVVFALGYMATRLVQGAMRASILPRTRLDKGAQTAAVSGLGYLGLLTSALVAVTAAGIDLSALAIVAGALSVGIGFGLQNIVQNFIAGIILLVERPITEGDSIEVAGKAGVVTRIAVRSTRLLTGDQAEIVVPNAEFISGIVTNLTSQNLRSRLVMPVVVAYGSDTRLVERLLTEIVEAQPLVLVDPAPAVVLTGFGQDGLMFEIRAILSDLNFKPNVQSEINHQIIERFEAEGVRIPLGQQRLVIRREEAGVHMPATRRDPVAAPMRQVPFADPATVHNDPASDPDEAEEA